MAWVKIVPRSYDARRKFSLSRFPNKLTFEDGYNVNEYQVSVAGDLLLNHTSTSSANIFLLKSIFFLDRFPLYNKTYKDTRWLSIVLWQVGIARIRNS